MSRFNFLLLTLLIASCSHYSPIYWGWPEWVDPDAADIQENMVAKLDWSKLPGVITSIDRKSVGSGYKNAKLSPRKHIIEYAYFPVEFGTHPKGIIEIELKKGHLYEFRIKLCFWCKPRRHAVWVDDRTTNELIWGEHPDWPSWFL